MSSFFAPSNTSLKVCGITREEDARGLVEHGVEALGVNFWPQSKRYISPTKAHSILKPLADQILRVGVFVNADPSEVLDLLNNNTIDVAQFHGDESIEYCQAFKSHGYPFIRAIGVKNSDSLTNISEFGADAILLDAHAPGVYGGTGEAFDWTLARKLIDSNPQLPILLAGGITAENAELATRQVRPAALDLASGSESAPGVKDFDKILAIQRGIDRAQSQS
ncbi:phosphoribosylanthranilate isomerase [Rubritalea marina]|uniref:phosphoribosylanthranilate isomerase n=1 Tax=Rubritalea marina TaxID=361055 RepID=UPI0003674F04|nr:phosphoribosylanthranilate isomerase [Rubritalea marina]